jgi:hypothetical protein
MDSIEEKTEDPSTVGAADRKLSAVEPESATLSSESAVVDSTEEAPGGAGETTAVAATEASVVTPDVAKTGVHVQSDEVTKAAPESKHAPTSNLHSAAHTEYPADVTFGCLMFTTVNNGELFVQWSDKPLPGSLALFTTTKKIPPFKFKKTSELTNNIGINRKKFVTGLAAFFKEADAYDGVFQILDCSEHGFGDVWVSIGGKKWGKEAGVPKHVKLGECVDINTIEAVALVPKACAVFDGLLKIDIMRFLNTGTREGAVWHRS